jgi:hypothetical protein
MAFLLTASARKSSLESENFFKTEPKAQKQLQVIHRYHKKIASTDKETT